jgi:tyrosyl-tRNA synthetase
MTAPTAASRPLPEPEPANLPTVAPVDDVLADLEWRGLIAQTTDREALARDLAAGPMTLYCGFDPTADSLHVGSVVPLLTLRRFQLAGHRPIALAGGATGFIGDPTGRSSERSLMTAEVVAARTRLLSAQMQRFLSFDDGPSGAVLVDNLDWTAGTAGARVPARRRQPLPGEPDARPRVGERSLESGGLSFTEFSYQLLQSMDYLELYRRHGCRLQVGGNDQWGNITAGLDLIRRVEGGGAHALTFPLITDAAGQKIGKSTGGGNVWLDPAMTTPYALYQFALNVDDRDVGSYLRLLTFLGQEEARPSTRPRRSARRPGPPSAASRPSWWRWCTARTSSAGCRRPARPCSARGS